MANVTYPPPALPQPWAKHRREDKCYVFVSSGFHFHSCFAGYFLSYRKISTTIKEIHNFYRPKKDNTNWHLENSFWAVKKTQTNNQNQPTKQQKNQPQTNKTPTNNQTTSTKNPNNPPNKPTRRKRMLLSVIKRRILQLKISTQLFFQ